MYTTAVDEPMTLNIRLPGVYRDLFQKQDDMEDVFSSFFAYYAELRQTQKLQADLAGDPEVATLSQQLYTIAGKL